MRTTTRNSPPTLGKNAQASRENQPQAGPGAIPRVLTISITVRVEDANCIIDSLKSAIGLVQDARQQATEVGFYTEAALHRRTLEDLQMLQLAYMLAHRNAGR